MSNCPRTGKRGWRSEEQAKMALRRIQATGERRDRMPTRYYRCPHCRHWHLTAEVEYTPAALVSPGAAVPRPTAMTPLEEAEHDRRLLERAIRRCVATGCEGCMHSVEWAEYRLRHEPASA